jgi:hypothetical protein
MGNYKIKMLLLSTISGADLLENFLLEDYDRATIRDCMKCNFDEMDRIGVPYIVQNAALVAGHKNKGKRPCMALTTELMEEYADRLTELACNEWKTMMEGRTV